MGGGGGGGLWTIFITNAIAEQNMARMMNVAARHLTPGLHIVDLVEECGVEWVVSRREPKGSITRCGGLLGGTGAGGSSAGVSESRWGES